MHANTQDFQVFYSAVGVAGGALTAGGAGDAVEVTSDAVDRDGFDSAQLLFAGRTSCAAGQTLKATVKLAESEDGTSEVAPVPQSVPRFRPQAAARCFFS
ncbi:hypothetical protein JKA73_15685 [Myxococcus xanthus]|uniref:hypothetical protein n=1 Tax=Myxococcus xanthus TaxID=34 RepID=UPI001916F196|nr:hypothetical protein [Myxococcus xanthus]QQR47406.1 hypothetical protein JKA73_15685 [Myxococcus xanthus]